jgi:hypothetical protein
LFGNEKYWYLNTDNLKFEKQQQFAKFRSKNDKKEEKRKTFRIILGKYVKSIALY